MKPNPRTVVFVLKLVSAISIAAATVVSQTYLDTKTIEE